MYTCLKDSNIMGTDEMTYIEDVSTFVEDILLGCEEAGTVLVDDKSSKDSILLESVGCVVVTVADLDCCGEVLDNSKVCDDYDDCDSIVASTEESSNCEIECVEEDTSPDMQNDNIPEDVTFTEENTITNQVETTVKEDTVPVVNNVAVIQSTTLKKEKQNKVGGLFSRLPIFRKRNMDVVEVKVNNSFASSINNLTTDLTNITTFKEWILSEGYISAENLSRVETEVYARKGRGLDVKFLKVARELSLISDDDCASILTKAYKREVSCYSKVDICSTKRLTKDSNFLRRDCFLISHDSDNRVLKIGHDIDSPCDLGQVETYFPGYKILCKEFVEGTTKRVVCDITD